MIKDLCRAEAVQICKLYFEKALKDSGLKSFSFSDQALFRCHFNDAQRPVSILVYRKISSEQGSKITEIDFIAAAKDQNRRGYPTKLIKSLGSDEIWLELREANLPALRFYEKNGFEQVGTRQGYYSDGENALNMIRKNTCELAN